MNSLIRQFTSLRLIQLQQSGTCKSLTSSPAALNIFNKSFEVTTAGFHTSIAVNAKWNKRNRIPLKWVANNKVIHPPQQPNEEPRNAYICHQRTNIKYSPDKLWYIACLVRGLTVDEAVKQLSFVLKKGATHIKEVILEAQEMAIREHNLEYKSNLWVAESFVGKGRVYHGMRRHARGRVGRVEYKHSHYFVRLEEGKPPANYYLPAPQTAKEQLDAWIEQMRKRKIISSL